MRTVGAKHFSRAFSVSGVLVILFCSIAGISALAQLGTGTILGTVLDSTHAAIPGATVTILNPQTGLTRTTTTDSRGAYRFPSVEAGVYTVKIEKTGFRTLTLPDLTLSVAQNLVANGTLQVGSTQQQVVVTGAAAIVNTTTTTLGGLVNDTSIAQLPLNGRNYTTLTLLQPGVTQQMTGTGGGQAGVWFSSNGATIHSNYASLDGTPLINMLGGSVSSELGTALGVDGIKEFRVITTGFGAEYGMSMGSQTVIVSKSGTNKFHGDAFDFLRNSHLDARNYFDTATNSGGHRLPELQRNDFGGSIGGPIRKNKTFFYTTFEGVRQNLGVSATLPVFPAACHTANHIVDSSCASTLASGQTIAVPSVMQPLLALYPSPNVPGTNIFAYTTNSVSREYYGETRVDQSISAQDSFFARYTVDDAVNTAPVGNNATTGFGAGFPQFRISPQSRYQYLTLGESHIFSPTLLAVTHLSYARTFNGETNLQTPDVPTGPGYSFVTGLPMGDIQVTGLAQMGPQPFIGPPNLRNTQNIYTVSEDVFDTLGNHSLQFGALINRVNDGVQSPFYPLGTISFNTIQDFMEGLAANYQSLAPGSPGNTRNFWYNTFGFYLQDNWKAMPRLTLNLGLRYEFATVPQETTNFSYAIRNFYTDSAATQGPIFVNDSLHNFSPRLGFAWDVSGNGKTAVRGAWGLYYDVAQYGTIFQQNTPVLPPQTPEDAVFNAVPATFTIPFTYSAANFGNNLFTTDYHMKQPKGEQYSLSVEHQLPSQIALTVSYVGFHGWNLYQAREGNPVIPTSVTGFAPNAVAYWDPSIVGKCANVVPSCRVNPNFTTTTYVTTRGYSWYNSLQVTANKQVGHGLEFNSAYTWSRSLDNTQSEQNYSDCTNGNANGQDPLFGHKDYGPSCDDLTQVWNLSLLYHFPKTHSRNFAAKILNGWWIGNVVTVHTGLPFDPLTAVNRACNDGCAGRTTAYNYATVGTGAATATIHGKTYNFVPFNHSSVNTGNPNQWFNPLMFMLQPPGYLGTASRNLLRAPGLSEWDFSASKDTALPFLGEAGNLEFRAEFFNILNHSNFGFPSPIIFNGAQSDIGAYSEAPFGTAGQITNTSTTSRQIQMSLKVIF
ncbi:MAG TPA: TonB-dependent receptor [Patescibacteria group bacterium]|nr:TonB-dependent receptor [Patescibacteria group bacterium]